MVLRTDLDSVVSLFKHFASLQRIIFTSYTFDRKFSEHGTHLRILQGLWYDPIESVEPPSNEFDVSYLPAEWTTEREYALHVDDPDSEYTTNDNLFHSRALASSSVLMSTMITEIYWECNTALSLREVLASRQAANTSIRKLSFRSWDMELEDLEFIALSLGQNLEVLDFTSQCRPASLRSMLQASAWASFKALKCLSVKVLLEPWDNDRAIPQFYLAPLDDHGPPGRFDMRVSPIRCHTGPALSLTTMRLNLQGLKYTRGIDVHDALDMLPSFGNLAQSLVAIGGRDCQYDVALLPSSGNNDNERDMHLFQQTLTVMLGRELEYILGRPSTTRVNHPPWNEY